MTASRAISATRFGYGYRPGWTPPADAAGLMAQLSGGPGPDIGGPPLAERAAMYRAFTDLRKARKRDLSLTPQLNEAGKRLRDLFRQDAVARLSAPLTSDRGFHERLAWFWADHFTVNGKNNRGKMLAARFEAEAIRPHISGTFAEMLRAASTHPAMLSFLDQFKSVGPGSPKGLRSGRGLNENLAREIIELHTLGVAGPYTQTDVREFAELLTGLTIRRETVETWFRRNLAEPGAETVLGETYGGGKASIEDIYQALDDLAAKPNTARHISRKLCVHFIADNPDPALVEHVAAAWIASGGDLPKVYEALLAHPAAWAPPGAKVRQPFDFIVASLRAGGMTEKELKPFLRPRGPRSARVALVGLNQPIYQAPGPDGWEEAAAKWITPQGLAARLTWAAEVGRRLEGRLDPRDFVEMALGELAGPEIRFAAAQAAERWEGLALVLASSEFNRR